MCVFGVSVSSQSVPSCRRRRCQCWLDDHDGSYCPHLAVAVVVVVVVAGVVSVAVVAVVAVVADVALAAVAAVAAVAASPADRVSRFALREMQSIFEVGSGVNSSVAESEVAVVVYELDL